MKKINFLFLIGIHMLLIVALIHKNSLYVGELYREQRLASSIKELEVRQERALTTLYTYKNPAEIKEFATHKLAMDPISLTQIHTIACL